MKKIAIIDDDVDSNMLLAVFLENTYEVTCYQEASKALESIRKKIPNIIILDIAMPDMDGIKVLQHIRADKTLSTIPVIALTAFSLHGDREKYLKLGFNEYISKPILHDSDLLKVIENIN